MIKYIVEFGLKKPILNHFLLLFLLILAYFSYQDISKEIFPTAKLDAVSIVGKYPGASSDVMDKMAVQELEQDLTGLNEASKVSSSIKNGYFSTTITLKDSYKPKDILSEVKDIVQSNKVNFPSDMDEPIVKEVEHAFPLLTVAIYADKPTDELIQIARQMKSEFSSIADLSTITINGESDMELLIRFDNAKLEAYGLDKLAVVQQLSQISTIFPAGIIKEQGRHYYLSTKNGEKDIEKLQKTIVRIGSKRVYLSDIATVEFVLSDPETLSHFNGKKNIAISINKGKKGDSIKLAKQIKQILKSYEKRYTGVEFDTYTDTSIWIKNRLNTVVANIAFGLFLLIVALFFLVHRSIAIVVGIGIPMSFMIALIFANHLGYSMNMLTLLGALIALGMLVDEAIVVGENIYRHMEMGKQKMQAAIDGVLEVYPAVLTATATTIFAFLPILLMSGETGRFMKMLPVMIAILLLSSLLEAFFFLPLHAKQIFSRNKQRSRADRFWEKSKQIYKQLLKLFLRGKYIALGIFVVSIVALTALLTSTTKFELLSPFDTTEVYVAGSVGTGNTLEQTAKKVLKIERKMMTMVENSNDISSVSSIIGMKLDGQYQPMMEEYYFHIFVNLHERAPQNFFDTYINPYLSPVYDDSDMIRQNSSQVIEKKLQLLLEDELQSDEFEELSVFTPKAGIVKNDIEIALSGAKQKVQNAIKTIEQKLESIKGVSNISNDYATGDVEYKFSVNSYGQKLGFDEVSLLNQLRPLYLKKEYAKMFGTQGIIQIKLQKEHKDSLNSLHTLKLQVPNSFVLVSFADIVDIQKVPIVAEIKKENAKKIVTVTASSDGVTSSEVYAILNPTLQQISKELTVKIKGEEQENQKLKKEMSQAFLISVVLIFIAMIWMFDSVVKSLILLSTIPLSFLGVLLGHMLMGLNISMPSLIGMVGLAGVIVNDGIIMMDFIKKAKNLEELKQLALLRLRPIVLTSLTTLLGLSTLIFFASGQALILQPMAVSLGSGVLWATVLNLFYIPLLYRIIYLPKEKYEN